LSLELGGDRAELERLATAVEEFAQQQGWPAAVVFKVHLVLEELVINVMAHGGRGGDTEIEVAVRSGEDLISISVVDNGVAFDPLTEAPEPETSGPIEDRDAGGLGVHLVRTMMDDVSYRREADRNRLTMTTPKS